jgi:3-oxoacyl-[acyl-carrier protein] reductase
MTRLQDKVALVTGAARGIGAAVAARFAREGATVIITDVSDTAGVEVARSLGPPAWYRHLDVREEWNWESVLAEVLERHGRLDVVVNNAGITRDKMLFNMTDEEFDLVVRVHLRGHFLLSRNAAAYWRGVTKETGEPVDAAVVNTASEAFLVGSPGQANYAAAKAGITALTLSTARGLAKVGVRANAICPRARTAMTAPIFGEDESGAAVDPYAPEHVAPLVTYLASPAAARITGQVFVVYGGMVALLAAPVVAERFDTGGDVWDLASLDQRVGGYFADRDPAVGFAADDVMALKPFYG